MTTLDFDGLDLPRKPWTEMTKAEKRQTYDVITAAFMELAESLCKEFDMILVQGQCTLRTKIDIHIVVDPNDDPRLP